MSIIGVPQKIDLGDGAFELRAFSDLSNPIFYALKEGVLYAQNETGRFLFQLEDGEQARIEIVDDLDDSVIEGFPGRIDLQWDTVPAASAYRIDEFVGSEWVPVSQVPQSNLSVYEWTSRYLENLKTYTYRVVPILANNDGYPRVFSFLMHRRPDNPTVDSFVYDSDTGVLTAAVS